jgi:hypothetical protein
LRLTGGNRILGLLRPWNAPRAHNRTGGFAVTPELTVFLAGIMQGSLPDRMHAQEYRREIAALVEAHLPGARVYDPFLEHPGSLDFDESTAREVFFDLMARAGRAEVLIAFLPEASMGTAIEMWSAYHAGAIILAVSPLEANWVVRFLSDRIFPDVASLESFLAGGGLETLLAEKVGLGPEAMP